jgi:hypothetical protein
MSTDHLLATATPATPPVRGHRAWRFVVPTATLFAGLVIGGAIGAAGTSATPAAVTIPSPATIPATTAPVTIPATTIPATTAPATTAPAPAPSTWSDGTFLVGSEIQPGDYRITPTGTMKYVAGERQDKDGNLLGIENGENSAIIHVLPSDYAVAVIGTMAAI